MPGHGARGATARSGGIELHPWNCRPGEPEVPGRLVFDLDPGPDVAFDAVIAAARTMTERLEALGLASFCKTTISEATIRKRRFQAWLNEAAL